MSDTKQTDTNQQVETISNEASSIRAIWNFDLGTLIRKEELNGRHYVVVAMVMILEGVHVGSQGPVYYSVDELAKTPKQWNMKPIVVEHPFRGDTATDLEVYKKQAVGMIMNTHFVDGKLKAEAWIDEELAQEKCPELIQHIEHRLPMEVSTGLFSELVMESGVWHGEEYKGKIINIRADHLAILPKKQGACSLSDGAGLLINQSFVDSTEKKEVLNIVTTVVNQTYPPGSNVILDYDLDVETGKTKPEDLNKDKEEQADDKEKSDKSEKEDKEEKSKNKIENAIKPEVFVTSDGNKITYEASGNGTLEIEKPDFGKSEEKEDKNEKIKVEPIHDNPIHVAVTKKVGERAFSDLLSNFAVCAEKYVSALERQKGATVANAKSVKNVTVKNGINDYPTKRVGDEDYIVDKQIEAKGSGFVPKKKSSSPRRFDAWENKLDVKFKVQELYYLIKEIKSFGEVVEGYLNVVDPDANVLAIQDVYPDLFVELSAVSKLIKEIDTKTDSGVIDINRLSDDADFYYENLTDEQQKKISDWADSFLPQFQKLLVEVDKLQGMVSDGSKELTHQLVQYELNLNDIDDVSEKLGEARKDTRPAVSRGIKARKTRLKKATSKTESEEELLSKKELRELANALGQMIIITYPKHKKRYAEMLDYVLETYDLKSDFPLLVQLVENYK